MKRAIVVAGAVLLLFSGCTVRESPESTDNTEQIVEAQPGIYIPESAVEQQTNGAVRQYALDSDIYTHISMMGERLVLAGYAEHTEVRAYSGDRAVEALSARLPYTLDEIYLRTFHNGWAHYLPLSNEYCFFDMQGDRVTEIPIPAEKISGRPVLSNDGGQIFYCSGQQIFAVDVQKKITRLVKSHDCQSLTPIESYLDGKILSCRAIYADGRESVLYIDTKTGQTLYDYDKIKELHSYEDYFFGRRIDGSVEQLFFGKGNDAIGQINMQGGNYAPALELNSVIRYNRTENGILQLQLLNLNEGKISSQIELQGFETPIGFAANRWKNCVWILTKDGEGRLCLLRWSVKSSPVVDETVYTGKFFTSLTPDEEGLENCNDRAKKMGKTYGVQLRIWKNAVKYPNDYMMVPEHQTTVINQCLDELEVVLKEFPKKFLDNSLSNQIRVCIVRSIDGEAKSVQYWNGSSAYIVLSVGCDFRSGFIKGLSYVVDSHVLGNSSRYDYWNEANPLGFSYSDKSTHSKSYLKGDARAFVDALSMTAVVEDRSSIFYEAMQPDNQSIFESEAMQKKLYMLCKGVRSAWKLKKEVEILPWEQYLDDPIAYKK